MPEEYPKVVSAHNLQSEHEPGARFEISPAPVDLLFAGRSLESMLPPELAINPDLLEQSVERRELMDGLVRVFRQVPDVTMEISQAVDQGLIDHEEVLQLYQRLTEFLARDPNNARLLLYLPFELLPDRRSEQLTDPREEDFVTSYRDHWQKLLAESDVRANFVDGDILESQLGRGEPPHVKKAAHLVPELVARGFVSAQEVIDLIESTADRVLQTSLLETLPVLADRSLLPRATWRRLLFSDNRLLTTAAFETAHGLSAQEPLASQESDRIFELFSVEAYQQQTTQEMFDSLNDYLPGLGRLLEDRQLAEPAAREASSLVLAALRLWPTAATAQEVAIELLNQEAVPSLRQAVSSLEEFNRLTQSPVVRKWTNSWQQKYLREAGEVPTNTDDLHSSELLGNEQAWYRLLSRFATAKKEKQAAETQATTFNVVAWADQLLAALARIDSRYQKEQVGPTNAPQARLAWEEQDKKRQTRERFAEKLAAGLRTAMILDVNLEPIINQNDDLAITAILGIRQAVKLAAHDDREEARTLADTLMPLLEQFRASVNFAIHDALVTTLAHWTTLGVVNEATISRFDITIPNLGAPGEEENTQRITTEVNEFGPRLAALMADPALSQAIEPVFVFFGSRLKGYANMLADLDVALFVKPGISASNRPALLQHLQKHLGDVKGLGAIDEIWLERRDDQLTVRNLPVAVSNVADRDWAHVLFGGVWYGPPAEVSKLQRGLLAGYLTEGEEERYPDVDARTVWLRELERETLQYRLMHKGYARYFPRQGAQLTEHADLIDGKSDFWDPGFRRVATELFLRKVFLPNLSQ